MITQLSALNFFSVKGKKLIGLIRFDYFHKFKMCNINDFNDKNVHKLHSISWERLCYIENLWNILTLYMDKA